MSPTRTLHLNPPPPSSIPSSQMAALSLSNGLHAVIITKVSHWDVFLSLYLCLCLTCGTHMPVTRWGDACRGSSYIVLEDQ